ncbi:hypothetical protein OC861_001671 [Tilletia horrida]|nr:hypothetical protein OC845_003570 [Tilletia horrida]KAK0568743.1 hypothetical protein OC861_001671 [Tilletia horrida]
MARTRSGSVGQFILTRSVEGCALEACHFQPIARLLPRSLADEAVAACRRCRSEANSSSQRVLRQGSNGYAHAVHLSKSCLASLVGLVLLIVTILNPLTTIHLIEGQLAKVHMLLSGEQEAEDDDQDRSCGGGDGLEDEEGMDEEEREIARAAARYQLAIESERIRIFGPAAGHGFGVASSPTSMVSRAESHSPARPPHVGGGASTSAVNPYLHHRPGAPSLGLGLSLGADPTIGTQPIVLTEVPTQPSWRKRRMSQGQSEPETTLGQTVISQQPPFRANESQSAGSSKGSRRAESSGLCESTEERTVPRPAPSPYSVPSSPTSVASSESRQSAREAIPSPDPEDFPTQAPLSPTTTLAHVPNSPTSTADLLHLYGPPLSPSFGPLDDAEDLARVALGTAASRSAMLASERALDRLFQASQLAPEVPDEFDLDAPQKGTDLSSSSSSPTSKRRRLPWQCPLQTLSARARAREAALGRHERSRSANSRGSSVPEAEADDGDTDVDSD